MKKNNSVVFGLSVKFSLILSVTVIAVIFTFFMTLRYFNRQQEYKGFSRNASMVSRALNSGNIEFLDRRLAEAPFFLSYIIYESNTKKIFRQKNGRIGILPETNEEPVHIISKRPEGSDSIHILYLTTKAQTPDGRVFTIQIAQNTNNDAGNRFIFKILLWIAIAAVPILLISFALCIYLTKKTMQPVVKITNAAASISSTNLDQRLPQSGKKDELDNLALTFNNLFVKLKNDFDRERSFTSNVSHELKTPIAVILGQTNLLRRWGKEDPQQLDKSLSIILQESRSMQSIITNMLQLTKLENKEITPLREKISTLDLFCRLEEEFKSVKSNLNINFSKETDSFIYTDYELLHQVFVIILSNSIKFIKDNPIIELRFSQSNKSAVFEIEDNGKGFNSEILPHVFERFYRGDKSHNRAAGGCGLGLSIAKAIVNILNGEITASNSKNGGALLTITLRCEPLE